MKEPTVSIVMSEYNTPVSDLKVAIQSMLVQTYKDFEFIIVDDGTANDLKSIVNEFNDSRVKILKNPMNMGFVHSLNNAIKYAKGKYIVRMDTDDIALPDRIEKLYSFITTHPEYAVVGSRAVEFSGKKENGVLGKSGEKTRKSIIKGDSLVHPSIIMEKSAIESVGYYKDFNRAEDLALWCELLLDGSRLYVIDDILLRYRVNPNDYRKRKLSNRKGEIKARLHYYPKLGASPIDYLYIIKSIIAGIMPVQFVQNYRNKFVLGEKK